MQKVNITVLMKFEPASYDVAVQHVNHYLTRTSLYKKLHTLILLELFHLLTSEDQK